MTPFPRAEVFLNWLFQQTLNVSVLVMVVLLIQWLFKKHLIARWRFALWWVVLVGLLLPVRPPSSFSLYNHIHADVLLEGPRYSVPASSSPVEPVTALHSPMENRGEMADIPLAARAESNVQADEPVPVQSAVKPLSDGPPRSFWSRYLGIPGREVGWDEIAMPCYVAIWLLGVVIFSLYVGRMVFRFRRQLAGHCLPASPEVQSAFDECRRSMQVSRRVELWETEAVKSPALYGLFRLQLLLPKGLAATFSEAELRHIFLHELAHVKRGDMWLNWLVTSLQIFHWFNPFIWLAFARLRADRELACDELALIHSGETQGQNYGQTILKLLENLNQVKAMPGLVGIVEDRKQMAQRLRRIAAFRLPTRWSQLAVLLVLGLALVGLTGAQTPAVPVKAEEKASASVAPSANTNDVAQLRIQVLDNESGRPVSDVSISSGKTKALTDGNGYASVPKPKLIEEGFRFALILKRSGYVAREVSWSSFQRDKRSDVPAEYTVRMDRGRTIGGYVRDESGKGIAEASIEISGPSEVGIPPRDRPLGNGRFHKEKTDANGYWTFTQAPMKFGDLTFDVSHSNHSAAYFKTDQASQPTTGPTLLKVADLASTNAVMALKKGLKLKGNVVDRSGRPVTGVSITMNREWNRSPYHFTNDAAGKFEIGNARGPSSFIPDLPSKSMLLTFQVEGYAAKSKIIKLDALPEELKIVLSPGKTIRGLVVNQAGQAITNVNVRSDDYLIALKTDQEGRFAWNSAPEEPATLWVLGPNHAPQQVSGWDTNGAEKKVVLTPLVKSVGGRTLQGKVLNAVTRQPLTNFTVSWTTPTSSSRTAIEFRMENGAYRIPFLSPVSSVKLAFSAAGFEAKALNLTGEQLDENQVVLLQPGEDYKGRILLPDGKLANGASVVFATAKNPVWLGKRRFEIYSGPKPLDTDKNGEFQRAQMSDCRAIGAVHEQGFALVPIEDFKKNPVIQLQAWGRIEGTLRIGDKVGAGHKLWLQPLMAAAISEQPELSGAVFATASDEAGRFVFEFVPPGEFKVVRVVSSGPETPVKDPSDRASVIASSHAGSFSHGTLVTVRPGENVKLMMGGNGIALRGKVLPPTGVVFDWTTMDLAAELKGRPIPWPWVAEKRRPAAGESEAFIRSKEYRTARRESKNYAFAVKPDGTIEISDVSPGTYTLELRAERKLAEPMILNGPLITTEPRAMGTFTKEVVIPEKTPAGVTAIDLGELVLSRPAAPAPASPKTNAKQSSAAEKQPLVAPEVPSSIATAKPASVTNAATPIFKGKVLDAVTRQPVTNFTVRKMEMTRPGPDNPTNIYIHAENGSFQIPLDAASKRVRVSFLFPGYEAAQLTLRTNEIAKEQTILMKPATDFKGRVLLPDGKPGIAAQVAFISATNQPRLGKHLFDCSMGQLVALADMDGEFDHPQIADCQTVAAISESGFIQIPVEEFRKNPVLRLQAWGRVEGVLRKGDKPWSGEDVALHPFSDFGSLIFSPSEFKVQTDAAGRFAFDYVPAGEFSLSREFRASPTNSWTRYFLDVSHKTNVTVESGRKTSVTLGGSGVRVTGKVSVKGQPWDWTTTRLFNRLEMNPVMIQLPEMQAAAQKGVAEYEKSLKAFLKSDAYTKAVRTNRVYTLTVKEDGALEVWGVPPGKYQLTMEAKQNFVPRGEQVSPSRLKLLATLKKEIVIPEPTNGKPAVFDLGNLILLPPGAE